MIIPLVTGSNAAQLQDHGSVFIGAQVCLLIQVSWLDAGTVAPAAAISSWPLSPICIYKNRREIPLALQASLLRAPAKLTLAQAQPYQTFQSLRYPFKGVGRKCTEPLVYSWAEIYQPPFAADGPRNIMRLLSAWAEPACQCIYIHSPS